MWFFMILNCVENAKINLNLFSWLLFSSIFERIVITTHPFLRMNEVIATISYAMVILQFPIARLYCLDYSLGCSIGIIIAFVIMFVLIIRSISLLEWWYAEITILHKVLIPSWDINMIALPLTLHWCCSIFNKTRFGTICDSSWF